MAESPRKQRSYDVLVTREVLGIQQKPESRQRPYLRRRLLSLPLLIGLATALFHLLTSPVYTVQSATVRGNTLIDARAIYQTSQVHGRNLFLLNTQAAAEAIERLPYVKQATVLTRLPAQVAIMVQEYRPRWVWIAGDTRFWIDETGNILPDNGALQGALTVVNPSGRPLPIGSRLEPRLIEMLNTLEHLMPGIKRVTYDDSVGFVLSAGPGWPVRVGHDPDQLAAKIGVLNSLLPELRARNRDVELIDLRYVERPYYRVKKRSGP